jgi:hypothetical protein
MDKCDNCNKPTCYGCAYADELSQRIEHQEQLCKAAHRASELVHWLSYQCEMSQSEKAELKRMNTFLENLRDRIGQEDID